MAYPKYTQPIIKQPREWKGVVLPHHSPGTVTLYPVYHEPEHEEQQGIMCTGNEGNIGIE